MARLRRLPGGSKNRENYNKQGPYYALVDVRQPNGAYRVKSIPLRTQRSLEAGIRFQEVEKVEFFIKEGLEYDFPWINGHSRQVVRTTLAEATEMYLAQRRRERLRVKTLELYSIGLRHLADAVGVNCPIENIGDDEVRAFSDHLAKHLAATSINMYLRTVKTFLKWALDTQLIDTMPRIKQILCNDHLPRYLSNEIFDRICMEASLRVADAFYFFRETGVRLREPFNGHLEGKFLVIPAEHYKTRREHQVSLTEELVGIYGRMMEAGHRPEYYSKQFGTITRRLGIVGHRFHDLRHTFALRGWYLTEDLYLISLSLGHSSLETTRRYAKVLPSRLRQDFPDIASSPEAKEKAKQIFRRRIEGFQDDE